MIYQIVVEKSLEGEPEGYNILVYIEEEADVFVVVQIDYSYYFAEYDSENGNYRVQLITSKNIFNSSVEVPIVGIMYNYSKQIIEDVRRGFIKLNSISTFEILNLTPGIETQTKVWTGNLIVSKVEGPFQNNKLVDVIDLNLPVYYLATPSLSNAHNSQILSIKWEYQYNDEESNLFKNSKKMIFIQNGVKYCRIDCQFHNRKNIEEITLYAYYKTKSPTINRKNSTLNKNVSLSLIWGANVTKEFQEKLIQICLELWGEERKIEMANGLMAVMAVETGKSFKAHQIEGRSLKEPNQITKDDFKKTIKGKPSSRAVGLIQFTQAALQKLGDFTKGSGFDKLHEVKLKYARMGEIKQLDKVKQYFYADREKIKSPQEIYLKVFAPTGLGQSDSFVLYESPSDNYLSNDSLDLAGNKNKKIERGELLKRYFQSYEEGKKYMSLRTNIEVNDESTDQTTDAEIDDSIVDITFTIYQNGEIKFLINDLKRKTAKYIYIDKENNSHVIGTYNVQKVKKFYSESFYNDKLGKDIEYIYLVDIRLIKNYFSSTKKFVLTLNTERYFISDVALASLLGAMLENDYTDYVFNGFSNQKGESIGGSTSHKHGINGDLRYLRIDKKGGKTNLFVDNSEIGWKGLDVERQNKFNDALYKFGWKSMLSQFYGENNKKKILNRCTNDKKMKHYDHLHLQSYSPTLKELKK